MRTFALAGEDGAAQEIHSLNDLRWLVTRAALRTQDVTLGVSDSQGHGWREVSLPLSSLEGMEADPAMMRRIGIGSPFAEPVLGRIVPGGPADRAGLQSGDVVLSVDGLPVIDGPQLRGLIRASVPDAAASAPVDAPPPSLMWKLRRNDEVLEIEVRPAVVDDHGQRVGRIEAIVGAPPRMDFVRYGFGEGVVRAVDRSVEMIDLTLRMFGRMVIGQASLRNISGPLTIADYAGQSAQLGLAYYLGFLAVVSISLGVLNLLPLPMLDGGHLLYYLVEGVFGRPIPDVWIERLQRGGLLVILMMMSLALYNDVARLIGLH